MPDGFRWCPTCKQAVAHENYARNSAAPSGFGSWCKHCREEANNDAHRIRTYGITKQTVAAIRVAQDDRCAICGDESPQRLDHDLGTVRALLCQRCNHGLGLCDEPGLLHTAALYVSGHREQHALAELVAAAGPEPDGPADVTGRR